MEVEKVSGFAKYTGFITKALGFNKKAINGEEENKEEDTNEKYSSEDSIEVLNRVVQTYLILDNLNDLLLPNTEFKIEVIDQCLTCGWLVCEVMRKYTDFISEIEKETNIKIK